jgi:tetratricopeptide (TPR) repeat protein/cold shock CspA family protein
MAYQGTTAFRTIMFHWIGAIERDLRGMLRRSIANGFELSSPLRDKAAAIRKAEGGNAYEASGYDDPEFLDLGDVLQELLRSKAHIQGSLREAIFVVGPRLQKTIPIRKRLAHYRVLEASDFPMMEETIRFIESNQADLWPNLIRFQNAIKDNPADLYELPISVRAGEQSVENNLPDPEFDETGFIGREADLQRVSDLVSGAFPVISIIGEGGIGKTALARRVADSAVWREIGDFDLVLWTTAKQERLRIDDVEKIADAAHDVLGLLRPVTDYVGSTDADPIAEIRSIMEEFRLLLIVDNVETVLDPRLDELLVGVRPGSKILTTSRVGRSFDMKHHLEGMTSKDATRLMRGFATARGVPALGRIPDKTLVSHCETMGNNPLFIRWFVQAIAAGRRAEEVTETPHGLLDFCLRNVVDSVSSLSLRVAQIMMCIPEIDTFSLTQLAFLSDLGPKDIEDAIFDLQRTSIISIINEPSKSGAYRTTMRLSDLPRQYLQKVRRPPLAVYELARANYNRMKQLGPGAVNHQAVERTHYRFVDVRAVTPDQMLLQARLSKFGRVLARPNCSPEDANEALAEIGEIEKLEPAWDEVHRLRAVACNLLQDPLGARLEWNRAIELSPDRPELRLWYGKGLRLEGELDEAAEQLQVGLELDQSDWELHLELALVYLYQQKFDDAERELGIIGSHIDELTPFRARRFYDQCLQLEYRRADLSSIAGDEQSAVDALVQFKSRLNAIDHDYLDNRSLVLIEKASGVASRLAANGLKLDTRVNATEVGAWLRDFSIDLDVADFQRPDLYVSSDFVVGEALRGKFVDRHPAIQTAGYIEVDDSRRIFVHRNGFQNSWFWKRVSPGDIVEFVVGSNDKGFSAVDVVQVDADGSTSAKPGEPDRLTTSSDFAEGEKLEGVFAFRHPSLSVAGYLEVKSRGTIFVHRNAFRNIRDWLEVDSGTRTRFVVGRNDAGLCATKVELV